MANRSPVSPLNQAHNFARVAERLEEAERLTEASECHGRVLEYLELSAKVASFPSTRESIQLQIKYHNQRRKILQKKQQYLKHKETLRLMEHAQKELSCKEDSLQWAIYQKIDESDSLIDALHKRPAETKGNDNSELGTSPNYNSAIKHPKNDHTVIEELHMLNSKLRELITQLLTELEESQKEAASLREKIKYYESMYPKKEEVFEDQNLIDFSSISSSVESIGIIS